MRFQCLGLEHIFWWQGSGIGERNIIQQVIATQIFHEAYKMNWGQDKQDYYFIKFKKKHVNMFIHVKLDQKDFLD